MNLIIKVLRLGFSPVWMYQKFTLVLIFAHGFDVFW